MVFDGTEFEKLKAKLAAYRADKEGLAKYVAESKVRKEAEKNKCANAATEFFKTLRSRGFSDKEIVGVSKSLRYSAVPRKPRQEK